MFPSVTGKIIRPLNNPVFAQKPVVSSKHTISKQILFIEIMSYFRKIM